MPSATVLFEGKVSVCITNKTATNNNNNNNNSNENGNIAVMERRWVVLQRDKLKVYDKKLNISRKKIFTIDLTAEIKARNGVYSENSDTRELYFSFPSQVCVFRFRQVLNYTQWATACKEVFITETPAAAMRNRSASESVATTITHNKNKNNSNNNNNDNDDPPPPPRPAKPSHLVTISNPHKSNNNNTNNNNDNTSSSNLRHTVAVSTPSKNNITNSNNNNNTSPSNHPSSSSPTPSNSTPDTSHATANSTPSSTPNNANSTSPTSNSNMNPLSNQPIVEIKPVPVRVPLDINATDDVALLKQEILHLRRRHDIMREERDSLQAILQVEKDFVRDRQNKLDSWEHFARLVVFKALCNQSKSEMLKATLNRILSTNLPSTKSVKISRMEVILVKLPTNFEESPNFGLTNYDEASGIATFNFKWYPQNCNITMQIDGQKFIGGAIPIGFKASIDLLSKLKVKGDLLISKGEGNQFLISLPHLPELTFASPTKLQIGDILDVSSFTIVQKVVESAVFSSLKKNLLQPVWKEVQF